MPAYIVNIPGRGKFKVTSDEELTESQAYQEALSQLEAEAPPLPPAAPEPAVVSAGRQIRDIPRQAGLAARYGIEGTLGALDVLGAPVRMGLERIMGREIRPLAPTVTDVLGLPQPQTPTERVVGDVSRAMAGAGLPVGAARLAQPVTQVGRNIAETLAARPGLQAAVSGTGGAAAGAVREAGGGPVEQTVAGVGTSLLTGMGAPGVISAAQRGAEAIRSAVRPTPPVNVDIRIENALRPSGLTLSELSPSLRDSLRQDISQATRLGALDDAATRRLVDYRLTGATPTRATLTLSPGEITRQKNLARQGANIDDPAAQALANIENQNNQVLLNRLNTLGAENALDPAAAGRQLIGNLSSFAETQQNNIRNLYSQAKASGGRSALLDNYKFTQSAGDALDAANLSSFLPKEFKRTLNQIATGKLPLTVDVAEQIKTQLATSQRSATDGNVRAALGAVREALDNAPLETNQKLGREAIDAFNAARAANRQFKKLQEDNPFLKKVVEGVEPDKFFEQQIIGQPAAQVKKLLDFVTPEQRNLIKNQLVAYIKDRATGGQADDVARLSGIRMSQALKSIGKDKLEAIFTKEEIAQLRAITNVARYEQFMPVGAAVNVSNTAAAAAGLLDRLSRSTILGRIPLGTELVGRPLQNILIGGQAAQATRVPQALTMNQLRQAGTRQGVPLGLLFQERE